MWVRRLGRFFVQTYVSMAVSIALFLAVLLVSASFARASGFAIIEHSATGMGNAFAGGSAIAEDASTVFFNPAGMIRLEGTQIVNAFHVIDPSADYDDDGSTLNPALGGGPLLGSNDDGGKTGYVPNFYISHRLNESWALGLGINAPFGLATKYDDDWVGRYGAIKSELMTINVNPSFAYRLNEMWTFGMGINIQYIDVTLSNALDSSAICLPSFGGATCSAFGTSGLTSVGDVTLDGKQELTGDDISVGWNFGFLIEPRDDLRFGVAYRSQIRHKLDGKVKFTYSEELADMVSTPYPGGFGGTGLFTNQDATARVDLPETVSVSAVHDLTDEWTIMGDVTWTGWRSFDELVVNFEGGQPQSTLPEDWEDSYRYSIGARYQPSKLWTLRTGVAYDETPIKGRKERTARIPGNDRTWLSFGAGYRLSDQSKIDIGYTHLFVDDTKIDNVDAFGHTLKGEYEADVNIYSVQFTYNF